MHIPIPDTTATYDGTKADVTVALLAVAQCAHGHNIAYVVPDAEDLPYYNTKAAQWAQKHANECSGAAGRQLKVA